MYYFSRPIKQTLYGSLLVAALVAARIVFTGKITYTFILWNLFLAFVPLATALLAQKYTARSWRLVFLTGFWLVFFPNAPYLITDLYHLSNIKGVPLWYDALLLFVAAFTGVAMGFISLQIMEGQWRQIWQRPFFRGMSTRGRWRYRLASIAILFLLTGFGVYLGRVARWNSWDVVTDTGGLAVDIAKRVLNPFSYKSTWAFTVVYAVVLYLFYHVWRSGFSKRGFK